MAVSPRMGSQIFSEFQSKKVIVTLRDGQKVKGALFTAQDDYLQVDDSDLNRRVTVPFTAVMTIVAG
jgi:hypothetical protein